MTKAQEDQKENHNFDNYYKPLKEYWEKYEYDKNNNIIWFENSNGYWEKYEYDKRNNKIYQGNSEGYWEKHEYDINGNLIWFETCQINKEEFNESLLHRRQI